MTNEDERHELEMMLPWHAAGTLRPADAARVDAALAADQELAAHFALVREEMAETIALNEALGQPSARALDRLLANIDASPARSSGVRLGGLVARLLAGLSPQALAWSAALAALLIVMQAGVIATVLLGPRGARFETASAPPPASAVAGAHVLVRFAPDASVADITRFLESNKATVADGPMPGGLYRLRVTAGGRDDLARIVTAMQGNKVIAFIAPE
jgi:hypothetical protein